MKGVGYVLLGDPEKGAAVLARKNGDKEVDPVGMDRNVYRAVLAEGGERLDVPLIEAVEPGAAQEWLWEGKIPRGMVTVLEGDPGVGKSFALLDLVARLTRRIEWPDGTPQAEISAGAPHPEVLVLGRRDDFPAHSRRLAGMEADLSRVHWWRQFDTFENENSQPGVRSVDLVSDLPALHHELTERPAIRLIVVDSLADLCRRPQDVEEALRQLNVLAATFHLPIVVTLPARCRFDAQGALRVTPRFRAEASRNVWCVAADPIDARQLLYLPRRVNFYDEPTGLPFRVAQGRVNWENAYRLDRNDPLHYWKSLENFLKWKLRDGPALSTEIYRDGSEMGFSPKQLRLAGLRLRIQIRKAGGFGGDGHWVWYTPAQWLNLANRASSENPAEAKNGESLEKAAESHAGDDVSCECQRDQRPTGAVGGTQSDDAKNAESLEKTAEISADSFAGGVAERDPMACVVAGAASSEHPKFEESLAIRRELREALTASVAGQRAQVPVAATFVSAQEQAKIAESMEKYAGRFDSILAEMRGDKEPAMATATTTMADSGLPAWKRPRKKR